MATREELQQRIIAAIDAHRDEIVGVGEEIRLNPELGYEEVKASQLLASHIADYGYEVEKPVAGIETAFLATRHGYKDGPHVAVLAEYDALAGIGHGCGHNLIGASGLAAAIGLQAVMDEVPGVFEVIGTPAEEGGAGKVRLQQAGVFDDVDAALMIHHAGHQSGAPTQYPGGTCLAVQGFTLEYFGKPAHAAADPYNGVNALNAVIEFFKGVDAMRQHVPMETRVHGIITNGGEATNVVPKYASCRFSVRSPSQQGVADVMAKMRKIAEGAALMTGCEFSFTEGQLLYDKRPSYEIGRRYSEHMREMGIEINAEAKRGMHSTDSGNLSYRMPFATGSFAISHTPIPGHSQQVVDASGSEYGYEQLLKVSKAMALTVLDLLLDEQLLAGAKEEQSSWSERYEGAAAR